MAIKTQQELHAAALVYAHKDKAVSALLSSIEINKVQIENERKKHEAALSILKNTMEGNQGYTFTRILHLHDPMVKIECLFFVIASCYENLAIILQDLGEEIEY